MYCLYQLVKKCYYTRVRKYNTGKEKYNIFSRGGDKGEITRSLIQTKRLFTLSETRVCVFLSGY